MHVCVFVEKYGFRCVCLRARARVRVRVGPGGNECRRRRGSRAKRQSGRRTQTHTRTRTRTRTHTHAIACYNAPHTRAHTHARTHTRRYGAIACYNALHYAVKGLAHSPFRLRANRRKGRPMCEIRKLRCRRLQTFMTQPNPSPTPACMWHVGFADFDWRFGCFIDAN